MNPEFFGNNHDPSFQKAMRDAYAAGYAKCREDDAPALAALHIYADEDNWSKTANFDTEGGEFNIDMGQSNIFLRPASDGSYYTEEDGWLLAKQAKP